MRHWIASPLATWTGNSETAPAGIVVEDDHIVELVHKKPAAPVDEVYDASRCVLLPGLINCHHHFYQTLTRACPAALNKELFDWLKSLYPTWAGLDETAIEVSSRLAIAELLLSGCTTVADHHYVFSNDIGDAIAVQAEVARDTGIRAVLTRGSMSLGESAGGLPPDRIVQQEASILKDSERLISAFHDASEGAMLQIALAPCSPFSVTGDLMRQSAQLARQHGVLLHTHLAETLDENDFCLEHFGARPLDYLEQLDWIGPDVWLAHGIHFTENEIQRLGSAGVGICHCPSSNMVLASGICRVSDLRQAGAPIGLGVDGSASNDASNLIQEVRQAFMLQRLRTGAAGFTHDDALHLATTGGASVLHRPDIGEIRVGAQADIALFNLDEPRFSGMGDPVAALVLCGAHRAQAVMVAGQWQVADGQLVDTDLDGLMQRHREVAARLAGRLSG